MRRRRMAWTAACAYLFAGAASAGEPSAEDLIARAPVIRSADGACKGIEVCGSVRAAAGAPWLKFRALYRAPDRYALVIRDGVDGAPLLWASGRKILVYDPVRPVVVYGTDVRTDFDIWAVEDHFRLFWAWVSDKERPSDILVDVRSLFSGPARGDEVVKSGDGRYRLTRTSTLGNRLVAHVDTALPQPYTKVELVSKDDEPMVTLDTLDTGGRLDDDEFAFPEKERLAAKVAVRDWPGDGLVDRIGSLALMTRAGYARMAAKQPDLRDKIIFPGFSRIDWDAVKKNDEAFTRALKELIGEKSKGCVTPAPR